MEVLFAVPVVLGILWVLTATAWGRKVLMLLVGMTAVCAALLGVVMMNGIEEDRKMKLHEVQQIALDRAAEHAKMAVLSPAALSVYCAHADEKDPDMRYALKLLSPAECQK